MGWCPSGAEHCAPVAGRASAMSVVVFDNVVSPESWHLEMLCWVVAATGRGHPYDSGDVIHTRILQVQVLRQLV